MIVGWTKQMGISSKMKEKVYHYLSKNGRATITQIANGMGIARETATRAIIILGMEGTLRVEKFGNARVYDVIK